MEKKNSKTKKNDSLFELVFFFFLFFSFSFFFFFFFFLLLLSVHDKNSYGAVS